MFKHLVTAFLLALAMGVVSAGEMILLEEAAEFETLNVRVSDNGSGNFRLQRCDECAEVKLTLSAATILTVSGKKAPLNSLNKYTLRDGTVFYRAESGLVTRIEASR